MRRILPPRSAEDGEDDDRAEQKRAERATDHERQAMTRKAAELPAFGFDLARDGDADERDENQRAGGGDATPAQINRLTWL
jgi:hypothetical protein